MTVTTPESQAAVVQLRSGDDVEANLRAAAAQLARAASSGARIAVLPENFAFLGADPADVVAFGEPDDDGPIQDFLSTIARSLGLWIVGGTLPIATADPTRVRAACVVFDEQGQRVARYDKINLFDVELPDNDECYLESASIEAGNETVIVDTPLGRMGLAVCYDVRFPELFRELLDQGAELIALPAAFTATTGAAHWEILLRARAVENSCYLLAAAQGGRHPGGRETYGHSMIVDPWGRTVDIPGDSPGTTTAPIDLTYLNHVRSRFPSLRHRQQRYPK